MSDLTVNLNSSVYYAGHYWNELPQVQERINRWISGDPSVSWEQHFLSRVGRVFESALMLNCGNGWVERSLLGHGVILKATGIDCSPDLLREAKLCAYENSLPLEYVEMDINSVNLSSIAFDLAVNVAAGHHIAYIDRVFRSLCEHLPEDGWFVSFDYVGPHRNQYPPYIWEAAWRLNETIPISFRQCLAYPHLPTMLLDDPTEAIHSELIVETFRRYFDEAEFVPLGGALAYPILTHNKRLFDATDGEARRQWVETILAADEEFLAEHPESTLFAYFAGKPKKAILREISQLKRWSHEEELREEVAQQASGEYYPRTAFQDEYLRRVAMEDKIRVVESYGNELAEEIARVKQTFGYGLHARLMRSPTFVAICSLRLVRASVSAIRRLLSIGES